MKYIGVVAILAAMFLIVLGCAYAAGALYAADFNPQHWPQDTRSLVIGGSLVVFIFLFVGIASGDD